MCRLENPFGKSAYRIEGVDEKAVNTDGHDFVFETSPGQKITFSRKPGDN
jgi:hypothetical protein